ncbi:MAG TPA: hypothetical protein VLG15_08855 [Thermoanaerobaculia bacterium]|nr:hypothetical protein [Thermoanaerobaculia bacterium]
MRRLGIIVFVLGLAGFVLATGQRRGYDTVEGAIKSAVSSEERSKRDTWETLRWISLGAAVFGAVLIVLPGRKT